ncbi:MAG: hypothetical protein PHI34_15195, partial [Acidobacteriota bacterium]|nr:hypothetical protein [Acidobacteriota bacterium]
MNKTARIIIIVLLIDALGLGGYFLSRSFKAGRGSAEVAWTVIDEAYQPANAVEAFIKDDAANRESLPVS